MDASLKNHALLASVTRTQLNTSWVGNRIFPYVNISNSRSPNPPPLDIPTLPNWLTV